MFKSGDAVVIKNQKQILTVEHVGDCSIDAVWFDSTGNVRRSSFITDTLERATDQAICQECDGTGYTKPCPNRKSDNEYCELECDLCHGHCSVSAGKTDKNSGICESCN